MADDWTAKQKGDYDTNRNDARARQATDDAIKNALAQMSAAGARNIVRISKVGPIDTAVKGYITRLESIIGSTPGQIERILGLKPGELAGGAHIYRLNRLPNRAEFDVRGYTTLPDGVQLPLGKTLDPGGWPPGQGVIQWQLKNLLPAAFLYELPPGEAFSIFSAQPRAELSGAEWWHANQHKYPNSAAIGDLVATFGTKVEKFVAELRKAGAVVKVQATRRNSIRAYLMHYSFKLSNGQIKATNVPATPGCNINWVHPSEALSRRAAKEMVKLFDIVYEPSLKSLHIKGLAIDMSISWSGTIKVKDALGKVFELGAPQSGAKNTVLHRIGATYGVKKLVSDAPHWSSNGH